MSRLLVSRKIQGSDLYELVFTGRNKSIRFGEFNHDIAKDMDVEFRVKYKEYRRLGIENEDIVLTILDGSKIVLKSNFPPETYPCEMMSLFEITALSTEVQDSLESEDIEDLEVTQ